MKHQLLSERRFFGEFLGSPELPAAEVLPAQQTVESYAVRVVQLASRRLPWLSAMSEREWLDTTNFFDVRRERVWVF